MSYFYPVKFAFGSSVPSHLPVDEIAAYQRHLSKLLRKRLSVKIDLRKKFRTIPVDELSAQFAQDFVKDFRDLLTKSYKILAKNTFTRTDDLVVVDVRGIIRSLNLLSLTNEISNIVSNDPEKNESTRFVLIVESFGEERVLGPIIPLIKRKKVCVIDSEGRVLFGEGGPTLGGEPLVESTTKELVDRMKYKLIRRIGHFRRPLKGQHSACNQFFYDGQYCIDEIKNLLFSKVLQLQRENAFNTNIIVYHCPESPWLADAIYKTDAKLRRTKVAYGLDYSRKHDLEDLVRSSKTNTKKVNILFVVALMDTGHTLVDKFTSLKELFPNARVTPLSILNAGQTTDLETKKKVREVHTDRYGFVRVDFFLPVEQRSYPVYDDSCPMCKYDLLPKETSSNDVMDHLTSYEMWLMCDGAGYKKEDFPPSGKRKLMKIMPDSIQLMRDNAAWLASKFDKLLSSQGLNRSSELIFLHPDETSNKLELKRRRAKKLKLLDTPSGYFAESLRLLRRYQCFSVPREIIRKILEEKIKVTDIPDKYPDFFKNLERLPEDIIIFDEVNVKGGTLLAIRDILKVAKKRPLAYLPILNLAPSKDLGVPVFSLYEFNHDPA